MRAPYIPTQVPWYLLQQKAIDSPKMPPIFLRAVDGAVSCETVQEYCADCGKIFNEETDCR